jgi:inositol transport system substrate-binding protein
LKAFIIALAMASAIVTSASIAPASATTIGVSMAYFDDNFLTSVRNAMAKEAKAEGVQIQFEDAQGDIGKQLSQIQNFAAQHVDAIIVNTVDTSATPKMTKLAVAAKIHLVYVNRMPEDKTLPHNVVFVGSDEHVSGQLQGDEIARRLNGKGRVVIIQGELSNNSTLLRTAGVEKAAAAHPDMKVTQKQVANWQRSAAIDLVNNWIVSGEKIDAIASNNDEMAIGAIIALQQAHIDPKTIVIAGVDGTADGLQEVEKGNLSFTVYQDSKGQGKGAVDSAIKLAKGEPVDSFVWVPFQLVTKDNLNKFLSN